MDACLFAGAQPLSAHSLARGDLPPDLALIDQMPIGMAIYDTAGTLMHANPHHARLVASETLPSLARAGPFGWQGFAADGGALRTDQFPCSRALAGETVCPGVDLVHFGEDGETARWLNVSAAPVCDPARGAVIGVVLIFLDTDEQSRADILTARAARRFRQFAERSSAAVWIADARTETLSYRNPRHLALGLGGERGIASIADWIEQVEPADRAALRRHYDRVRAGATAQIDYRLCAAGSWARCTVRETSFPVHGDTGEIAAIGGMTEKIACAQSGIFYLVGSRDGALDALERMLVAEGQRVKTFCALAAVLDVAPFLAPGCVVVDLATVADVAGDLPRLLARHRPTLPTIILGEADTPATIAVAAMRSGAVDYLVPPFAGDTLTEALCRASASAAPASAAPDDRQDRLARLSRREREVLAGLAQGGTNKSIGRDLGISPRTVELHRAHLMERMNVRSLAELLQIAPLADPGLSILADVG